ncbi:MFS general substrate transporter [Trametes sanguinea]|nr:MFS general substrate transporter [Trametes sanguinea]
MSLIHECFFVLSVCGVTILNIFLNGALIIALPTIGKALDFSEAELQWPLNVYALSYGSLILLCGRIADIVGAKRMFLSGTGFIAIWSIATGVAPKKVSFIVFVALTGIGAAANTPTGISIFANHFESGPKKNLAIAALAAGQSIGYVLGLIVGGVLCQSEKLWPVIFYIQGGLAVLFFILGVITISPDSAASHKRYSKGIDWVGAALSVSGLGLLIFVLSESTSVSRGWKTPWVPALLVVSIVVLGIFITWETYRERRGKSVILPISLWAQPGTKMAPMIAVVFFAWASFNCLSYFVTLFYQQVRGDSPVKTALETVPFTILSFALNIVAGALLGIVRGDVIIALGLLGTMVAPLILALIDEHASYWRMAFWFCTAALTDIAYTVGNLHISLTFDPSSQGLAGGIFNVATRLGTSVGLALSSSVANAVSASYQRSHPDFTSSSAPVVLAGIRAGAWVTFGLGAVAFVLCVLGLRGVGVMGRRVPPDAQSAMSQSSDSEGGEVDAAGKVSSAEKASALTEILPVLTDEEKT